MKFSLKKIFAAIFIAIIVLGIFLMAKQEFSIYENLSGAVSTTTTAAVASTRDASGSTAGTTTTSSSPPPGCKKDTTVPAGGTITSMKDVKNCCNQSATRSGSTFKCK